MYVNIEKHQKHLISSHLKNTILINIASTIAPSTQKYIMRHIMTGIRHIMQSQNKALKHKYRITTNH